MNNLKNLSGLLIVICFFFFACEGPAGPAGDVGPQGPAGEQGEQGQQGDEGNANVKTIIFNVYKNMWIKIDDGFWAYEKNLSIITSEIAYSGLVLVFLKSTNSDHWQALPYTWPGTNEKIMRYWYGANQLQIDIYSESDTYEPTLDYTFKVAAIEGNLVTKAKKAGVNINDSNQLKIYFNIE